MVDFLLFSSTHEFFTINTKLSKIVSKVFTAGKKVTSSGARPDDHLILSELTWHVLVRGSLN